MTKTQGGLSILQITDMHILPTPNDTLLGINTNYYFHTILELAFAKKQHFDLVLLTGDLAQDPCPFSYRQILNSLLPYNTPCICLPGNHDDFALMQQIFNTAMASCRKQLVLKNWQLICLNSQIPGSPGGRLSQQELVFLEDCLRSEPNVNALIAVHHHCLETKSAWMDTMMIDNSQALFSIIRNYSQVKAITTGHIHQIMDTHKDSVRIFGTPSTCFQFTPESHDFSVDTTAPGFRVIQLFTDGGIESEVIRLPEPLNGLDIGSEGY
jgi:3',5'-cyclic-AMP phosphodiesterase